jgi:hypothetical protein
MNFLEQLVGEWYQYHGFYVNQNVKVGRRDRGGWEGELDIVAFHPTTRELVHVETSMDARSWDQRRAIFKDKFERGRQYIPEMFPFGAGLRQEAVFGYPRTTRDSELLGPDIKVLLVPQLMELVAAEFRKARVETAAVPESYPLLRAVQFALDFGGFLRR